MRITRRSMLAGGLGAGALALGGCAFERFAEPFQWPGAVKAADGVAYGEHPRQKLDIWVPEGGAANRPVIVFFYGGGWEWGERGLYGFVGSAFAAAGYVAVVADYRVGADALFPNFVEDAAWATRWTLDHIATQGGDPARLVLAGHSAGAHIAALVALDPVYAETARFDAGAIRGVAGLSGPYAFDPTVWETTRGFFRTAAADPARAIPVRRVRAGAPPFLLIHGADDDVVPASASAELAAALAAVNVPVELKIYPTLMHPGPLLALSDTFAYRAPVRNDMLAWIARITR